MVTLIRRLGLEPEEARRLALMGLLVATLLCAYTLAKVLRDAMFLTQFGALSLPYAYVGVALASATAVWLEGIAARRFTRVRAAHLNQYLAIACGAAAALAYPIQPHWTAAIFYLWTGSQAMMLLPHFWVLALDVWDSRRARRVFPVLSGFGLMGGIAGGVLAAGSPALARRTGLMWVLCVLLVLAHLLTLVVERYRARRPTPVELTPGTSRWRMILGSRYLRVFALGLALSVVVSTLVDFQFKYYIQHHYADPHAITRFLGRFYVGLNVVSLLFQFGVAGWLIQRIGLTASTGLQPTSILLFSTWIALSAGWWAVLAMRWVQGVVFQTLGKSSSEIYYAAIRASERRWIKPAVDTLVERWSDGLVGVLLVVALRTAHVSIAAIAVATAVLAAAWIVVLFRLDRQYGTAYQSLLSSRRVEPADIEASLRQPAGHRAVLEALRSGDERRVLLALGLAPYARDRAIRRAVRDCLRHPAPAVRTAAVQAMEEMRLPDPERLIDGFVADAHEPLRRAAIGYRVGRARGGTAFVQQALAADDATLRAAVLDALFERPWAAAGVLRWDWVDARIRSGTREDLLLAARALGILAGRPAARRFAQLLAHDDLEVRRAALVSAARRPRRELLDRLVPLLADPRLGRDARQAVAAIGDAAVPALRPLLAGAQGPHALAAAANTLSYVPTARATRELLRLARGSEVRVRDVALRSLARLRVRLGEAVVPRSVAHRLFLRELHDYRDDLEPARALAGHAAPEVRLLAESYRESADLALQRALEVLALAYEPAPVFGVYERLRTRARTSNSPALDYLGTLLPRPVFKIVGRLFEPDAAEVRRAEARDTDPRRWIDQAGTSGDAWLRACAVRAARAIGMDPAAFAGGTDIHPLVAAELDAAARAAPLPARAPAPC